MWKDISLPLTSVCHSTSTNTKQCNAIFKCSNKLTHCRYCVLDFLICGLQHLFILFILWILSTSMWNYSLMHVIGIIDVEFNSWNLYSRRRGHLCWNTVEELIKINSIGIFIKYVRVWPEYSTMELLGSFCRIGSAGC